MEFLFRLKTTKVIEAIKDEVLEVTAMRNIADDDDVEAIIARITKNVREGKRISRKQKDDLELHVHRVSLNLDDPIEFSVRGCGDNEMLFGFSLSNLKDNALFPSKKERKVTNGTSEITVPVYSSVAVIDTLKEVIRANFDLSTVRLEFAFLDELD